MWNMAGVSGKNESVSFLFLTIEYRSAPARPRIARLYRPREDYSVRRYSCTQVSRQLFAFSKIQWEKDFVRLLPKPLPGDPVRFWDRAIPFLGRGFFLKRNAEQCAGEV